ncbi:MAG: hypothetical protein CMC86_05530 [Flavobacteriaceae bacterium]|nr:hypothetical protein [Flavobacteriaceae bacterium]|tara:strand:+ start:16265 stop:17116 length:852 start_codon:yes stop_codon:yes gene_type:complete
MKIALCLSGIVGSIKGQGGEGELLDPAFTYKYVKKYILDHNPEIDVFIHCWNTDLEEQIVNLYNPKLSIFEKQKVFKKALNLKNPIKDFQDLKSYFKLKIKEFLSKDLKKSNLKRKHNACSRWYSNMKVLKLKKDYEIKNKFTYDHVMITRFDVAFLKPVVFSNYNNKYFYASHWNDLPRPENNFKLNFINNYEGKGFLDLWFFSNSKNMDLFASLYENMDKYSTSPHFSSREHVATFLSDKDIKYTMFRWQDFEMVRAYFFKDLPPHGSSFSILSAIKNFLK